MQVLVRDNNVDQALKALKKKMQREGIFREMKLRGHYEKPSEKKAREKAEAVRRARKLARKRAQREGLIPMKPKLMAGGPGAERGGGGRAGRPWRSGGGGGGGGGLAAAAVWRWRRFRTLDAARLHGRSVQGAGGLAAARALVFWNPALSSNVRRIPWVNSVGRGRPRRNPDRSNAR